MIMCQIFVIHRPSPAVCGNVSKCGEEEDEEEDEKAG